MSKVARKVAVQAKTVAPKQLSPKDFGPELQRLALQMEDKNNWESRFAALQELQAIFAGDCSNQPDLQQVLNACVRQHLKSQIEDLRSAISREACQCVKLFVLHSSNANAVELISDWFTPSLFHVSCATAAVMAQAAEETLKVLASSGRLSRVGIQSIFTACASKHATVRKHGHTCMLLLLQSLETALIAKHSSTFETCLRAGVTDALQEVRATCRVAYWAFEVHCPKEAQRLLQSLEGSIQRAVSGDKESYFEWLHHGHLPGQKSVSKIRGRSPSFSGPREDQAAASPPPVAAPKPQSSSPTKIPSSPPPSYSKSLTPPPNKPRPECTSIEGYAAKHVRPTPQAPNLGTARRNRAKSPEPTAVDETWFEIVSATQSHDWLCRLNAISSVNELLDVGPVSHTRGGECVQLLIKMLSDSHYRVVIAATAAIERLLSKFPEICLPFLERLMAPLFPRLADSKEQVREAARLQLEHIRKTYPVETLFPILHKVLDEGTAKSKIACVEFMNHLVGFSDRYFSVIPQLRTTVNRLLSLASRTQPGAEVSKSALACLNVIYDRNREAFVTHIVALTSTEQNDVLEVLRKAIPHLSQDVRRKLNGEALLPHPATGDRPKNQSTPSPQRRRPGQTQHIDPMQQYRPNAAKAADVNAQLIANGPNSSPSPIAAWRAERANPPEIVALKNALTSEEKRIALNGILATLVVNPNLWIDHFKVIIPFPISQCADASDHQLRAMSQQALRHIMTIPALRDLCTTVTESILRAGVSGLDDAFETVQREALQTFMAVLQTFGAEFTLPAMIKVVEALLRINARCLQLVLRELSRVFARGKDIADCRKLLPEVIQVLTGAFEHDISEVRKTVVLNFVDLYQALGTELLPLISHLAISKLRLISIYVNRSDDGGTHDLCKIMTSMGLLAN